MRRYVVTILLLLLLINLSALPRVMVTGYWNPTGSMISTFSTDPELNPDGWTGADWEGLGFDVYSFFPTPDTYEGVFAVDYQGTSFDFWTIVDTLKPIAIISFGAGNGEWEIEYNARNLTAWVPDNEMPYYPTPNPPDESVPVNHVRNATLPLQAICDAVNAQTPVAAWVDWNGNPGAYLCEFMAYHGMWYQDNNASVFQDDPCLMSGFIHVDASLSLENVTNAAMITVRETINSLNSFRIVNGSVASGDVSPEGTTLYFRGPREYLTSIQSSSGVYSIPYMMPGDYYVSAVRDGYYYQEMDLVVDESTGTIEFDLTPCESEGVINYHGAESSLFDVFTESTYSVASRYTVDELGQHIDHILGKINVLAPDSSSNCKFTIQVFSADAPSTAPETLLYSYELEGFEADELIEHTPLYPIFIEADKEYWVGYEIVSDTGKIAWLDNQNAVSGKSTWIKGINWAELLDATDIDGNWMIDIELFDDIETGISNDVQPVRPELKLANYPNPFNPTTVISYILPETGRVSLDIFNVKGQKIQTLINKTQEQGTHTVSWDGQNYDGKAVASGVYFYRVKTRRLSKTGKMLLMK